MSDYTYEDLLAALDSRKVDGTLELECFIERAGLEWEYLVHVHVTDVITVADLLDHARKVLIQDRQTLPAEWIHTSIDHAELRRKGGDVETLNVCTPLWKVKGLMDTKLDPVIVFTMSPLFEPRFVYVFSLLVQGLFTFHKNGL